MPRVSSCCSYMRSPSCHRGPKGIFSNVTDVSNFTNNKYALQSPCFSCQAISITCTYSHHYDQIFVLFHLSFYPRSRLLLTRPFLYTACTYEASSYSNPSILHMPRLILKVIYRHYFSFWNLITAYSIFVLEFK